MGVGNTPYMAAKKLENLDASVSSLVGGAIILAIAFQIFLLFINGTTTGSITSYLILFFGGFFPGISVILLSIYALFPGKNYKFIGGLIIALSFLSWLSTEGGLLIGFIMVLVGGMMIYFNQSIKSRSRGTNSTTKS